MKMTGGVPRSADARADQAKRGIWGRECCLVEEFRTRLLVKSNCYLLHQPQQKTGRFFYRVP